MTVRYLTPEKMAYASEHACKKRAITLLQHDLK